MAIFTTTLTATIASGQTTSGAVALNGCTLVGLILPAALTGATMAFNGGASADALGPVHTADGAYSVPVAAGRAVALDPTAMYPWEVVQVVSGSAEAADRTLTLVLRQVGG